MYAGIGKNPAHDQRLGPAPEALLADLRSGLDALRSLLAEIDEREQLLGLDTFCSILSQFDKLEPQRQMVGEETKPNFA